jgi:hypothetical protein
LTILKQQNINLNVKVNGEDYKPNVKVNGEDYHARIRIQIDLVDLAGRRKIMVIMIVFMMLVTMSLNRTC